MLGVLVAPYALPTLPDSSRRIGWPIDQVLAASVFDATSAPCLPAAPLLIASHTTPSLARRFAASVSEPTLCAAFTYGHPGLNHSSTTILSLNADSLTSLPDRSFSAKSGAGLPTTAADFTSALASVLESA